MQRPLGGDGREPLVPEGDRQLGEAGEVAGEGAGRLRPRALAAVHVLRQPEHQPADRPRFGEPEERGGVGAEPGPADGLERRGDAAPGVGDRDPDRPRAEVEPDQRPARRQRRGEVAATSGSTVTARAPRRAPPRRSRRAPRRRRRRRARASARTRAASSRRPSTPSERMSCAQSSGGPPSVGEALAEPARPCPRSSPAAPRRPARRPPRRRRRSGPCGGASPARRAASATPARSGSIQGASGGASARSRDQTRWARSGRPPCSSVEPRVVARHRIRGVERQRPGERRLGLRRDVAAGREDPRLGEVDEVRRRRPVAEELDHALLRRPRLRPAAERGEAAGEQPVPFDVLRPVLQHLLEPRDELGLLAGERRRRGAFAATIASASACPGRSARAAASRACRAASGWSGSPGAPSPA